MIKFRPWVKYFVEILAFILAAIIVGISAANIFRINSEVAKRESQKTETISVDVAPMTVDYKPQPEPEYREVILDATAYCPCEKCCGHWAKHREGAVIGASGEKLVSGVSVAVDPDYIPYGTEIIIDGHKFVAQDCGGAIKGNRIDIYFDNHEDALRFGRQHLIGRILEK